MPGATVISFINYKGGVGKTTTTYHVGCSLAQHHAKKVLLVDIDPQMNLNFLCAPYEKWEDFKRNAGTIATMYQLFLARQALDTRRFIWRTPIQVRGRPIPNVDLMPCDIELLVKELGIGHTHESLPEVQASKRQAPEFLHDRLFLKNCIRQVKDDYDYILIDCPPNLYLMTQNALIASQWYIITAIPDHLSTIGLSILQNEVEKFRRKVEEVWGYSQDSTDHLVARLGALVFVKVRIGGDKVVKVHARKMQDIEKTLPRECEVLGHTTELIGYSEAAENSVPVWGHDSENAKRAASKREYERITEQLVRRFDTGVKSEKTAP